MENCRGHLRWDGDGTFNATAASPATGSYVQVRRLMGTFALAEVTHAIEDALLLGTISFDAGRHLPLCRIEQRPPRLDMENYPHLPMAQVRTTQAADYSSIHLSYGAMRFADQVATLILLGFAHSSFRKLPGDFRSSPSRNGGRMRSTPKPVDGFRRRESRSQVCFPRPR
jgi:hypothetical protein